MTEYIAVIKDDVSSSAEHRYLRLPHPRTGEAQLYLPYDAASGSGICEVVKVGGSKGRTWFIGDDKLSQGSMLIHHPIDPLFLAIPIALSLLPTDSRPAQFQTLPDLLATAASSSSFSLRPAFAPTAEPELWNADVSALVKMKPFRRAFKACCDRKLIDAAPPSPPPEGDAGPVPKPVAYYRPSRDAILKTLQAKVDYLAAEKRFNMFDHLVRGLGRDGLLDTNADSALVAAARTRASIEQISQYLPPALLSPLMSSYDFLALDAYLADRAAAAMAAAAPIVPSGNKKDAGAKRKAVAQASRGVETLKKVNTTGMAKMTSFFKPKDKT